MTTTSCTANWMREFFTTTSTPVGHGFTQTNLDRDFASYSFRPKAGLPIKVIVLDDTMKGCRQRPVLPVPASTMRGASGCSQNCRDMPGQRRADDHRGPHSRPPQQTLDPRIRNLRPVRATQRGDR
ncbi:MAG: hypothetical protein IPO82_04510 [Betaproteobacteria bacterium]|nr:hypothetical protein [Betaproteobacteria bacterium]